MLYMVNIDSGRSFEILIFVWKPAIPQSNWGRRDRMVVRFKTTYAISTYHYYSCEFKSHSNRVYLIQHYVIKFVSDLQQVGGILLVPIKLTAMI
jgi:hypothetical protein